MGKLQANYHSLTYLLLWNVGFCIYMNFWCSSELPASVSESIQNSPVKNKHPEEDPVEVEGREVKRLKYDTEEEAEETSSSNQSGSREGCSAMAEETETTSPPQDKEKETICERQHCKEDDDEEGTVVL